MTTEWVWMMGGQGTSKTASLRGSFQSGLGFLGLAEDHSWNSPESGAFLTRHGSPGKISWTIWESQENESVGLQLVVSLSGSGPLGGSGAPRTSICPEANTLELNVTSGTNWP